MILSTGLASKSVIIILTLWLAVASAWTNAASKVVLLYDERIDLPGLAILDASLRATLVADRNHRIEIFREEMNLSRFGSESYLIHLREHLREKYRDIEVDVVVPVMGPALFGWGTTLILLIWMRRRTQWILIRFVLNSDWRISLMKELTATLNGTSCSLELPSSRRTPG